MTIDDSRTPDDDPAAWRWADIDAFRREAHRAVEWVAEYLSSSERYPVLSQVAPGDIRRRLPASPPLNPMGMSGIQAEIERVVMPGVTHWNSPQFMAYFATTASPPAIIGELYSAALNQNALVWQASPALNEVEAVILDWLRQMLGLPEGLFGIIYDTASISTLCAVAAARDRADPQIRSTGCFGRARLRLYASEEAHSVVDKAAMILGIGHDNLRKIPVYAQFRLMPGTLEQEIQADLAAGYLPFCVVATVGTTSTTSIDPVPEIADIAARYGLWLHVDAAYGGSAAIAPEMRWVLDGCDRADSFCVNPHKWLFVPLDFSAFYTRDPESLRRSFAYVRPYLETDQDELARSLTNYGPQLGRRFRGLKLWFVIQSYGVSGLQAIIRRHLHLASQFEQWVLDGSHFELMAPRLFSTVCFRARPDTAGADLNAINAALLRKVNGSGDTYLSHTRLGADYVLRLAIGNMWTDESHVFRTQEILTECLEELLGAGGSSR